MFRTLFACLVLLAATAGCVSPSPAFFGATRGEVVLGGIRFVVFHDTSRAEVVRMGYLRRSERRPVPALMAAAAAQVSGCRVIANSMVTKIPGDTGVAQFSLDCKRAAASP
jgi:hypothetical protein